MVGCLFNLWIYFSSDSEPRREEKWLRKHPWNTNIIYLYLVYKVCLQRIKASINKYSPVAREMLMEETTQTAKQQLKFRMVVTFKIFNEDLYLTLLFVLTMQSWEDKYPSPIQWSQRKLWWRARIGRSQGAVGWKKGSRKEVQDTIL